MIVSSFLLVIWMLILGQIVERPKSIYHLRLSKRVYPQAGFTVVAFSMSTLMEELFYYNFTTYMD